MKKGRIGDILVEEGMITARQLQEALERQKETSRSLGQTLVELAVLSEDALYHFLAIQHGMEFVSLTEAVVSADLLKCCPESAARKLGVFPLQRTGRKLRIVTDNPENPALLHLDYDLVVPAGTEFEVVLAKESELKALIDRYYKPAGKGSKGLDETLKEMAAAEGEEALLAVAEGQPIEVVEAAKIGADDEEGGEASLGNEGPVIRICNFILDDGILKGASDIHINPYEKKLILRFRIDGALLEFPAPAQQYKRAIASRIKIMARLDPMERRRPQDGRIKYKFRGRSVDLRVATLPSIWGENIVMRIIDQGSRKLDMKEMNFEPDQYKYFEESYASPYGMVLVTGPSGSGKTTTLYSVLAALNDPQWNIMTAEDPVEYRLPHIIQTQVNPAAGMTFAAALRSFLRQDPDIIMVGEIRDRETADTAIKAALTGHVVISTLHTNDAPATIVRLIDMGVDPMYVGTAVLAVCSQKLLRRVCSQCKQPHTPSAAELREVGLTPETAKAATFFKGTGCPACLNTGYKGRVAIHEVLKVNAPVRRAIFDKVDLKKFKEIACANGMATLRQVALMNCMRGATTLEEVAFETTADAPMAGVAA